VITQTHRFHGRGSLRFVYQRGATVRTHEFSLRYVRNPRAAQYRVAVVVSRKVSKSAVVRNRIRRRLYEVVRVTAEQITEPFDLVFIVYDVGTAQAPHAALQASVVRALHKAGAIPAQNRSGHAIVVPKVKET
jgi:ribonuclease P protein component